MKKKIAVIIDELFEDDDIEIIGLKNYDALLIPGGYSPDKLRAHESAVNFVRNFFRSNKPVFAICHGPQLLISADILRGKRVTGWRSIRILILFSLIILLFSASCLNQLKIAGKTKKPELGEKFSLKINESAEIKGERVEIVFNDVLEDSRCYADVRCFWSGIAKISITVRKGDKSSELELTLYHENEKRFNGYKIMFVGLKPERISGKGIRKEEYEAFFVVERAL